MLTDNLCNLLALITSPTEAQRRSIHAQTQQAGLDIMLAFARRHLPNPSLSPQLLAEHLNVSVRTVHKRFEQADSTFGRWVLEKRLEACRTALDDPRFDAHSVSQIAFAWGFNDLSHFTKAFKLRFAASPGRYRREMRAQTDHS